MITYQFLQIGRSLSGYLTLITTDEDVGQWLVSEVEKYLGFKLKRGPDYRHFSMELKDRDIEVLYWAIKLLCQAGWEPFAVWTGLTDRHLPQYCFRRAIHGESRNS